LAASAPLQFVNSEGCRQWLEQLTLTNVQLTQQVLTAQLASLSAAQLAPLERLKILEALRDPALFVQGESRKRYAGKGVPLDPGEKMVWTNVLALWQGMSQNYQQCLKAYREGDLAIAPYAALVAMRCLRLAGDVLAEHCRTYRQPPAIAWRSLHELYGFAEQHGFARIRVHDTFGQRDPDSSCAECYVQVLLTHLANPYSLSARQLSFVERWLEGWASLVGFSVQPPPAGTLPLLAVDLASGEGVTFAPDGAPSPGLRYLEIEQLSKTLRQTINLLKQGQTPLQLGLGEDARQPGCENLLMLLYVQWCRAGSARSEGRAASADPVHVCFGLNAAHLQLGGDNRSRPAGDLSSLEKQDLDTYGYLARASAAQNAAAKERESVLEEWETANQSTSGFTCIQRAQDGRTRVSHNQLLVLRRAGDRQFQLGVIQWLRIEEDARLRCGVRLLPGMPQAVLVRPSNFSPVGGGKYERALLLPEVPAPSTPATLVLPAGWFQSGRFVEVHTDRKQVAKLLNLLEKGSDYDRGTIVIV
jgi:cyclic-di-GMP-binding protein